MNLQEVGVILINLISFILPFILWIICYNSTGSDTKNACHLYSYNDNIKRQVWNKKELQGILKAHNKDGLQIFFYNLLLFFFLYLIIDLVFYFAFKLPSKFLVIFTLFSGIYFNLFDLLIIDICWFRNTKRVRFSFIKDEKDYKEIKLHFYSFIRGIIMFIIITILIALIFYIFYLLNI